MNKDLNSFSLISNGFLYNDCWEKIDIRMSMENVCNELSVGTLNFFESELGLFKGSEGWRLKKGDYYYATVNGEVISTGYIDEVKVDYDGGGSNIDFYMRDKTSDIVDCCYYSEKISEFKKQSLANIIIALCVPFKITVVMDPSVISVLNSKIIDDYTIDQGRSVAELIVEECVKIGVLATTDGYGNLYLTRPTLLDLSTDIINDTNILSASMGSSLKDRFSNYITKAEIKPDQLYNVEAEQQWLLIEKNGSYTNRRRVEDAELSMRYRPLILLSDTAQTIDDCTKRSVFEANIRKAKGLSVSYTIEGWTEVTSGRVWKPNRLVTVNDKKLEVYEQMLINSVQLSYDSSSGFKTTLDLVRKECYSLNEEALLLIKKGF